MVKILPLLVSLAAVAVPVRADAPADLESGAVSARGLVKTAQQAGKAMAERRASLVLASSDSGPLQCRCTQWGGQVRLMGDVCTHRYCPSGDDADCRKSPSMWKCDQSKRAIYLQSTCEEWKQSFCEGFETASLVPGIDANPAPRMTLVSDDEPCRRWISYDARVTRCPVMYKFLYYGGELDTGGQSWSTTDPWGNSSCRTKNVRVRECAD